MEMVIWHLAHFSVWGRQKYVDNVFPQLYDTLLPSALARARNMAQGGPR
jgi:hypothetical protein